MSLFRRKKKEAYSPRYDEDVDKSFEPEWKMPKPTGPSLEEWEQTGGAARFGTATFSKPEMDAILATAKKLREKEYNQTEADRLLAKIDEVLVRHRTNLNKRDENDLRRVKRDLEHWRESGLHWEEPTLDDSFMPRERVMQTTPTSMRLASPTRPKRPDTSALTSKEKYRDLVRRKIGRYTSLDENNSDNVRSKAIQARILQKEFEKEKENKRFSSSEREEFRRMYDVMTNERARLKNKWNRMISEEERAKYEKKRERETEIRMLRDDVSDWKSHMDSSKRKTKSGMLRSDLPQEFREGQRLYRELIEARKDMGRMDRRKIDKEIAVVKARQKELIKLMKEQRRTGSSETTARLLRKYG